MTTPWKAAGFSFNRYSAIAARTLRRSLKEEKRAVSDRQDFTEARSAKWEAGKQLESQTLSVESKP